jgi:hypothetical protein
VYIVQSGYNLAGG